MDSRRTDLSERLCCPRNAIVALAMLCEACQDIFSTPRWLSCGTYYSWKQNPHSFQAALLAGCHLCNLIEESRSYYDAQKGSVFPNDTRYAFKALNPKWTRSGKGQKWLGGQIGPSASRDSVIDVEQRQTGGLDRQGAKSPTRLSLASYHRALHHRWQSRQGK